MLSSDYNEMFLCHFHHWKIDLHQNVHILELGFSIKKGIKCFEIDETTLQNMTLSELREFIRARNVEPIGVQKAPILALAVDLMKVDRGDLEAQARVEEKQKEMKLKRISAAEKRKAKLIAKVLLHLIRFVSYIVLRQSPSN